MIKNYLKIAWRNLQKNKVFSFINIFGLTVGLTCCMLLTLYIWHESSYDNYHPNIDRLYQIGDIEMEQGKETRYPSTSHPVAALFKSEFPDVEATARICPLLHEDKTLIQYFAPGGDIRTFNEEKGFMADSGFFRLFKYNFVEGNAANAINGPYSIVLSKDIADKLFGGESALNKTVHVSSSFNGDYDYTVTGVFDPIDKPSHIDGRFFISMYGGHVGNLMRTQKNMASNGFFITYVLLRQGTDAARVERLLPAFVERHEGKDLKASGSYRKRFLIKVKDIHLHADMAYGDVTPGGSLTYLYILASIALFTLLIACINFMNLATARSAKRSAEVGVRKTLGAERSSLIWQFLGESLLMTFIAFVIALGLTILLLPSFNHLAGKHIILSTNQAVGLGAIFLFLAIFTGLLAGSYPAFYLSSFKPVKVLKGKISNSLAVVSLRKGLVIFQFCISIILIMAAVVISRQMQFLRNADLGFNKDQQLILPLRSENARKIYTPLKAELGMNPDVLSVGASFFYPGTTTFSGRYNAEGKDTTDNRMLNINIGDFDFLKTLQVKAVSGHLFSNEFPADSIDGIVLNEEAVRQFGYAPSTCIGKKIYFSSNVGRSYKIVGVVKDFHFEDLHIPIGPIGFLVNSEPIYNYITAHIKSTHLDATIASIRSAWQKYNPKEPFEFSFLDDQFQKHYDADNRLAAIVGYSTAIAIVISCLGLFGLAAFSAEQRTKEIGIRKVLGASEGSIVALLSKEFLKLVTIAALIGSPIGWFFVNRWLQNFAYRANISWTVFIFTTSISLLIAFLTISFQAIKAATTSPVKSLRAE